MATRQEISDLIEDNVENNNQKKITAEDMREVLHALNNNGFNDESDVLGTINTGINIGGDNINLTQALNFIKIPLFFITFNINGLVSSNIAGASVAIQILGTAQVAGPNDDTISDYVRITFGYNNANSLTGKSVFSADLNRAPFRFASGGTNQDIDHTDTSYSFTDLGDSSAIVNTPVFNAGFGNITATFYARPSNYLIQI